MFLKQKQNFILPFMYEGKNNINTNLSTDRVYSEIA